MFREDDGDEHDGEWVAIFNPQLLRVGRWYHVTMTKGLPWPARFDAECVEVDVDGLRGRFVR